MGGWVGSWIIKYTGRYVGIYNKGTLKPTGYYAAPQRIAVASISRVWEETQEI